MVLLEHRFDHVLGQKQAPSKEGKLNGREDSNGEPRRTRHGKDAQGEELGRQQPSPDPPQRGSTGMSLGQEIKPGNQRHDEIHEGEKPSDHTKSRVDTCRETQCLGNARRPMLKLQNENQRDNF